MVERRAALGLASIGAISVGLRLPFLSVPLITDEAGYAYVAHWLGRGYALYRDLWFDRPQGIFLIYSAILRLFGESTEAIRLGAALYNAATALLIYKLGTRLWGWRAGLAAAAIFAVTSASPTIEGFTANGELFMSLPIVACLLLADLRHPFAAGVALALAVAIKPTALPIAGAALVAMTNGPSVTLGPFVMATRRGLRQRVGQQTGQLARLALGTVAGLAPFAAHGLATDAKTYWFSIAGFRIESHSAFSVGASSLRDLAQSAPSVAVALLPVWLLVAAAIAKRSSWDRGEALALATLAGAAAGAAAGGYWYWHYYVALLPGAALLAGRGLDHVLARGASSAARVVLLAATALAVAFNIRLLGETPEQTSWRVYQRPAYLASKEIADYVRQRTSEHELIYAAFSQADVYFLSGRRSAGAQLYWTEINRIPGAFEAIVASLDDPLRRPTYIVQIDRDLETAGRADTFWARVAQLYRRETMIGDFAIYRLKEVDSG